MMNYEEDNRSRAAIMSWPVYPLAMALTCQEAIAEARRQLIALGWGGGTDAQLIAKIRSDCTLFTGADNPIRLAIFGTAQCPTSAPACNAVPGGQDNTMMMVLLGVAAALAVGVVIVASRPTTKKIMVARIER